MNRNHEGACAMRLSLRWRTGRRWVKSARVLRGQELQA
jgi:hypothetical protein